jgi:Rod binding domain-containing protein
MDISLANLSQRPPADPLGQAPTSSGDIMASQSAFARMLGAHTKASLTPAERTREAAEQFVAQVFVQPILKQFRDSDRTPAPFGPSSAEKQFRALMDADLAQRITKAQHFPLVERLAQDLLKRSIAAPPP